MRNFFIPSGFLLAQERNNTAKAGAKRGEELRFGPSNRYRLYSIHTRWDDVQGWFVTDAEEHDEDGLPVVVSQGFSAYEALGNALRRLEALGSPLRRL